MWRTVVDQGRAGGLDSVELVGLAAASAGAAHRWHGFDDLLAGCLQYSGQAISVRAGAFDGPEDPLSSGKMLEGPCQQASVPIRISGDLGLGPDGAEPVDQGSGVGVGVGVNTDRPAAPIGEFGGLATFKDEALG